MNIFSISDKIDYVKLNENKMTTKSEVRIISPNFSEQEKKEVEHTILMKTNIEDRQTGNFIVIKNKYFMFQPVQYNIDLGIKIYPCIEMERKQESSIVKP